MFKGANGLPDAGNRATFVADASNPVELRSAPNGDLFYVDLNGGDDQADPLLRREPAADGVRDGRRRRAAPRR